MQMTISKKQIRWIYLLSFIIPIVMMAGISLLLGMYPFGERTILISDMNKQFNDYFAYFKTIIAGDNNLIYTFSKNLGGDMIGFSAYYLQNPFLLILLLFPNDILPLGIWVMIILQVACSSLSFCFYLNRTNSPSEKSILFSLAYAFMGYVFAYITLPIYFCNIILLPLVILGIHKIIKDYKDKWLYIITLALSILCNYYIGYMLCIFSLLFFLYLLFTNSESFRKIKDYSKHIYSYLISSILGVLLTAFDIIPVVFSLRGQKDIPTESTLSFYRNFRMMDAFSKLYSNMYDGNTSNDNLPFIYVGILAAVFVFFFFFSQEISKKEKIITFIFLCTMLVCFYIHTFDVIWHGFNEPVGFPYRYAFYFSFLLLHVAYKGFSDFCSRPRIKECLGIAGVFVLYSCYLFITNNSALVFRSIVFDAFLLLIMAVMIYGVLYQKWSQKIWLFALLAIQIADLSANAVTSVKQYTDYVPMQEYSEYVKQVAPVIDYVKTQDTSLYRMEKIFQRTHNDAMQFNYKGLSHSSSCEKDYVKQFMEKLGFRNFGLWAYYDEGGTAFADCFLGVKYYISKYDATGKPYEMIYEKNKKYVYQNPYALPFAFGVKEKALSIDMTEKNSFELQNEMASIFDNQKNDIYSEVTLTERELVNLEEATDGNYQKYTRKQTDQEAYIEYELDIINNRPVYLFFEAPERQAADITVNGVWFGNYFSDTKWDIIEIGSFQEGDTVSVQLGVKGDAIHLGNAYFYYEDKEAIAQMYQQAASDLADLKQVSDSHISGTIKIEDSDYLLFTIPYEAASVHVNGQTMGTGWQIKIDGSRVAPVMVFDALMAVPISQGEHTIEMVYVPQGIIVGTVISAAALLICLYFIFLHNKKIKTEKTEEEKKEQGEDTDYVELKLI